MPEEAQRTIDCYLSRVRARLRGHDKGDIAEIHEELSSHITDKAAVNGGLNPMKVDAALAALGDPEEVARQYLVEDLLHRAEVSRSPLYFLQSLTRWASASIAGSLVLLGSMFGYFFGAVFILLALLKPLHPRTAGIWTYREKAGDLMLSLRLGFGGAPGQGQDVLGWWLVPLGLLAGCGMLMLTTRVALWCVRQYRRSPGSTAALAFNNNQIGMSL